MMHSRSALLTETSKASGRGRRDAAESSMHDGHVRTREPRSRFRSSLPVECGVLQPIVQISPIDTAKRHSGGCQGVTTEIIYAPAQRRIECRYSGPRHLLLTYVDGVRRDGETFIDGLPPSTLRNVANKLTFVPANHAYNEWHETQTPMRISYLYLDPSRFNRLCDEDTVYAPKAFFDDSAVWSTVTKLRHVIESGKANKSYVDALINVLAHELSRSDEEEARDSPVNRGGLATWQMRTATKHIEEHLGEQISLVTLARLARLSPSHFCRAFKQSFGVPPHEYHLSRRMQHAKALLSDRATSITEIGLRLGYSNSSSFTLAFRKITGQSPSRFRRNFR